jgi:hypothetical protein
LSKPSIMPAHLHAGVLDAVHLFDHAAASADVLQLARLASDRSGSIADEPATICASAISAISSASSG